MRKFIVLSLFSLGCTVLNAQKIIHDPMAELRSGTGFQAIKVSGGIDLYLSHGDEAIAVSAKDAETRDHIKTEVTEGVLKIWFEWKEKRNNVISGNKQLRAYVSYKNLLAISGSGGSDILIDGSIQTSNLYVNISGGSDFKGAVQVGKLTINASGGSDVAIEGKATIIDINASGGSDISGFALATDTATIEASGGSDIDLTVNGSLNASASGGSDIRYKGAAKRNETRSSGASSVKKAGN